MGADYTQLLIQGGKLIGVDPEEAPEGAVLGKAVELTALLVDIETEEITLALAFPGRDKTIRREIPRGKLTQTGLLELVDYGADTFPEVAKHYCAFLRNREEGAPTHYIHRGVGWGEYDGTLLFKHHRAVGFPSTYRGTQYAIAPNGTLAGWQALAREQILGRPWLELALVLGLSAPLVGLISRRTYFDSLFVHIYGTSSTGKTTAARVAVSPWGYPDTAGNGLIKTWNGSDVSILSKLRQNNGMAIALDEASVQNAERSFTSIIYQIALGRDKDRLDQSGRITETGEWDTTVISTAEHSLFDRCRPNPGLRVRLIELGNKQWTQSADHANALTEGLLQHYGLAGVAFVERLLAIGEEALLARWRTWTERVKEALTAMNRSTGSWQVQTVDAFTGRVAGKHGLVLLTAELAREALALELDLATLQENLLRVEAGAVEARNFAQKAYDRFLTLLVEQEAHFSDERRDYVAAKPWGKYDRRGTLSISREIFAREMAALGYDNLEAILDGWHTMGKLIREDANDRRACRRVLSKGQARVEVFSVRTDR
jgi:putative DNA primase/helicase